MKFKKFNKIFIFFIISFTFFYSKISWADETIVKVYKNIGYKKIGVKSNIRIENVNEKLIGEQNTDPCGIARLPYECKWGDKLQAQPIDKTYYYSKKKECTNDTITLFVKNKSCRLPGIKSIALINLVTEGSTSEDYFIEYNGHVEEIIQFPLSAQPTVTSLPLVNSNGGYSVQVKFTIDRELIEISNTQIPSSSKNQLKLIWNSYKKSSKINEEGIFKVDYSGIKKSKKEICISNIVEIEKAVIKKIEMDKKSFENHLKTNKIRYFELKPCE